MKNILLSIPNLGLGGAQRVFHDHSVELARKYKVTEAVFNLDSGNLYPSGNKLESLDVKGGGSFIEKIRNFVRHVNRLRELKEKLKIDISISHLEGADYVNLLSKGSEKVILCIHGSKLHDGNIRGVVGVLRKNILMPRLYNRADCIVTVSRDINSELTEHFGVNPKKIVTINNFFEVTKIFAQSQKVLSRELQDIYATAPVLVTSGRLTLQKNQAPLLDIFAKLLCRRPAKLIFVGDGELRTELAKRAQSLGLRVFRAWDNEKLSVDHDVYFMGMQENPFQYIRPAALFVFPSAWEGFPMALGEAMACGTPVVTTDCPTGPREILAPNSQTPISPIRKAEWAEYGVLMPMLTQAESLTADIDVWSNTLDRLLSDNVKRQHLSQVARVRMEDFTRERIFKRWLEIIERVLTES